MTVKHECFSCGKVFEESKIIFAPDYGTGIVSHILNGKPRIPLYYPYCEECYNKYKVHK